MTETTQTTTDRNFNDDLIEGFGKTNYSNTRYETWRLKDDSSYVLGIFPPMKSLLQNNSLFEFWTNHWGWAGQNGDPSKKPFQRPFLCLCIKDYGMIRKECVVCNLRKKYLDRVEAIKVRGKALGKTDEECKKAAAKELEWLRVHGVDSKARLYAYDKAGQVGILEIPYSLAKQLREEMKKLTGRHYPGTEKPINPTGRVGVFFEFIRIGKASPKSDSVRPHMLNKTIQGEEVQVLDLYRIPDDTLKLALNVLPDLAEFRDRNKITDNQAEALVKATEEGQGAVDPQVVDSILGIRKTPIEAEAWTQEVALAVTPKTTSQVVSDDELFGEKLPPRVEPVTEIHKPALPTVKENSKLPDVPSPSRHNDLAFPITVIKPEVQVASDAEFDSLFA